MRSPAWLDSVPNISFDQEKEIIGQLVEWAEQIGWQATIEPQGYEFETRVKSDLVLAKNDVIIRVAVKAKSNSKQGMIRLQCIPTFRDAEIVWEPKTRQWHIELGGVPIDQAWNVDSFAWLVGRLTSG